MFLVSQGLQHVRRADGSVIALLKRSLQVAIPSFVSNICTNNFHNRLELEHNYITKQGNTWSEDRRCGDCSAVISTREEYVHHLGVSHRHVLQFLPAKFRPPAPTKV